jgi:acyl-CoA synthetase (NDP forming)
MPRVKIDNIEQWIAEGSTMNVRPMIEEVRRTSRTLLTEIESKALLKEAGIPTVETLFARSKEEAVLVSKKLRWPWMQE